MGWIVFALWLLLTPVWITYWFSAGSSSKITFGAPALVLMALGFRWLWRQFVVFVAGEPEPSPPGKIQELTADWRAERGLVFRPKRSLHPVWGLALPSRGTIRAALIAGAAGACVGAAVVFDRPPFNPTIVATNEAAPRPTSQSGSPISVRTEVVKSPSLTAVPSIQNSSPVPSSDKNAVFQRAEVQPAYTNDQSSADRPGCDVSLCERYYRSFRASDCTYQPYDGPRQYCTR
jgi:hypothetical protein